MSNVKKKTATYGKLKMNYKLGRQLTVRLQAWSRASPVYPPLKVAKPTLGELRLKTLGQWVLAKGSTFCLKDRPLRLD